MENNLEVFGYIKLTDQFELPNKTKLEVGKTYVKKVRADIAYGGSETPEVPLIDIPTAGYGSVYTVATNLTNLVGTGKKVETIVKVECIGVGGKTDDSNLRTNAIKVIEIVDPTEIIKAKIEKARNSANNKWNIDILKAMQKKYPLAIIGGSASLFLRGIELSRSGDMDFDIILPYYDNIAFAKNGDLDFYIEESDDKNSGNDFDNTYLLHKKSSGFCSPETIKVDVRISPTQKYDIVEYEGFQYKCATLLDVWEAKIRYAAEGNIKHLHDLYELLNNFKNK